MRKLLLAAAAFGLFASEAAAQPYPYGPPPGWRHRQPYNWCQARAARLYEFEWRMRQDGRVSRDEARIAQSLRADLAASCGGGRWHPRRGWYYG